MMKWLKLTDDLAYSEAERFVARTKREDAKLRKLGGNPNNSQIEIRKSFNCLENQRWAVWVVRTYELS
jgi:hypothetical protein